MALLFSPPQCSSNEVIHIVAGKTYARDLRLSDLIWLDEHFAISESKKLIVSPYLDYRQLSNARITQLVELVLSLQKNKP